jgi:hypothetical protein
MSESTTTQKPTVLEVADSATGYEERAVIERFGQPLATLQLTDGAMWARALVFILRRREDGVTDEAAEQAAMSLTIKDAWDTFGNPSTESGKDEPESETTPESSQPSAS